MKQKAIELANGIIYRTNLKSVEDHSAFRLIVSKYYHYSIGLFFDGSIEIF